MPKSGGKNNPALLIDQLLINYSNRWLSEDLSKNLNTNKQKAIKKEKKKEKDSDTAGQRETIDSCAF